MRVLLINPWQGEVFPPPALGYLQAVIKQLPDVACTSKDITDITAADLDTPWDLVAVTFHSFSVRQAINIRQMFAGRRLVCGGHHPSALPKQMLAAGYDQVVIGEGENAIISLINGDTASVVQGTPTDLNALPVPDYAGFGGRWTMGLPIISSRGCPFDCTFCASADFWGRRCTMRSADNVLAEVLATGVREFMFEDDNFTLNRTRVLEICAGLRDIGGLRWQCASRAEVLTDDELCWALHSAGCHTVWLGVESFSQDTLDRCNKRTTVARMLAGIKNAHIHGLGTMSQLIVGLPDDTQADIDATVRTLRQNKIGRMGTNLLWVLPNTRVHQRAKAAGFDDDVYMHSGAPYYTIEQDIDTLHKWNNQILTA